MQRLLRLRPFRALAFIFMDTNLFRNALEERLKREYIVRGSGESDDSSAPPTD
jgi:hypothetical protein